MKKQTTFLILVIFFLALLGPLVVSAELFGCCEQVKGNGGQCQEVSESQCASGFFSTICESVASCQLGTCFSSNEGDCIENTPKKVCEDNSMSWSKLPKEEVSACQLGCCANFGILTSEAECNSLSSDNGLEIKFDSSIQTDVSCSSIFSSGKEGACSYDFGGRRTCNRETDISCKEKEGRGEYGNVIFNEGYLCSDENVVRADCGPSIQTTCIEGIDQVFFLDTCGNLANIYDSKKQEDPNYWSKILPSSESCTSDPKSCGNCDSSTSVDRGEDLLGTTCRAYESGLTKPNMGDYVCEDLGCVEEDGTKRKHGESWCIVNKGNQILDIGEINNSERTYSGPASFGKGITLQFGYSEDPIKIIADEKEFQYNTPGTVYSRASCWNGEIVPETCEPGRTEICVETEVNGWGRAVCKSNLGDTCLDQRNKEDCLDKEKRTCNWFAGGLSFPDEKGKMNKKGYCAPVYSPGFEFWTDELQAENICSRADNLCEYQITQNGFQSIDGSGTIEKGKECISLKDKSGGFGYPKISVKQSWVDEMESRCMRIGDCGPKENSFGFPGDKITTDFWRRVAL